MCVPGWLPCTQTVRHGSKAVTRHRKPMHFLKQKLMAVTEFIPPRPSPPERCIVPQASRTQEHESGLVVILRREVEQLFQDNKMILVAQNNAITAEDMLLLRHKLHRLNVTVKFYPNQVMRLYLSGSKFQNLAPLFIAQNVLLVSKEPKVKEVLRCLRTTPQMVLLGGCIEDTLLSLQGVHSYSRLPSLAILQGQVVSGLTLMTSQTAALLHRHPTHLSALLQQYVKQQAEGSSDGSTQAQQAASA
ncbi:RM10 protein, partial [Amia calva]|nr:RM10 protein [Amia calva]